MPRFGSIRTSVAAAALAALLGGAPSPAGGDDPWRETGEWWRSPIRGVEHRILRHDESGEKALAAPDGTRYVSVEAAAAAEASLLARAEIVAGADLRGAAEDPGRRDVPAVITFRLGSQPLHDAGEAARRRHGPRFARLLAELREILGRVAARRGEGPLKYLQAGERADEERSLLTEEERERVRELRVEVQGLRRSLRAEVLAEARPAVAREQAPVAAWIESRGGTVLARAVGLNAVSALVTPRVAMEAVDALPEVHRIEIAGRYEVGLNSSVPTIGAGSWTGAGYDGTGSTKVCVLDTGIDATHPALDTGVVTDAAVYLAAAKSDPQSGFNDNENSTDDLQFHGTHVGGIVMSTDSTFKGVAPGGALMNGKCGYRTTSGGGSLYDPDIMDAGDWASDHGADVFNCSFGGGATTNGNSSLALFFDAMAHDLNISAAISAGNSGSSSGTILTPADGFNVVTVGAFDDNGSGATLSDDAIASFSSRGPCSDGRRKPDLSAPGVNVASCFYDWEGNGGSNSDFVGANGTSMAAPHVAGSLCLLEDFSASWAPESMKALLVTNVRIAGNFSGSPDNNNGYGALDLAAAFTNKACVIEGTLSGSGSGAQLAFFRAPSLSSGGRTSLCWNRQVVSDNDNTPTTYYTIVDLDLFVYDEADNSADGSGTSTVNSVEQVKLASALSSPVVKVKRSGSFPSGVSAQDFSVAAEAAGTLSSVAAPSLACVFTAAPTLVTGGADFTVSVRADNGGGLPAFAPTVTLTVPAGYSIQAGSNPQVLAKIDGGADRTATWTVRSASSGSSGSRTLQAGASSSSFGEAFSGAAAAADHDLDLLAPTGSVAVAGGAPFVTSVAATLEVSAEDDLSGVSSMRFSNDGTTWSDAEPYGTTKSWALAAGADGARTVRVRFRDDAGNESSSFTDDVVVDTAEPTGTVTAGGGAAWTAVRGVALALDASDATSGVAEMRFGPDGMNWGPWLPYAAAGTFNLSAGDGAKTVHAQFRDEAGLVSDTVTDDIGLDQTGPAGTVEVAGGAGFSTTGAVALALTATDGHSGVVEMRFSNDGTNFGAWSPFAVSTSWTLSAGDGAKTVHAQFRDAVGNVTSPAATDGIVRDGTPPEGSLSIDANAVATASTSVTLGILATDGVSGVASMRLRNGTGAFGGWQPYATTLPWTFPSGDAPRTVGVQFLDNAGNVSLETTDAILLDQTPPTGSISVLGGSEAVNTTAVTVDLGYSDNLSGVSSIRLGNDGVNWTPWLPAASSLAWVLEAGEGTRTVHYQARDAAGNVSTAVFDSILLDVTLPTGSFVLNGDRTYLLGAFPLVAETSADDGASGSGVAEFRASHDGGTTWTAWLPIGAGEVEIPRPAGRGTRRVVGQFRDLAGNSSAGFEDAIHLVEDFPQSLASAKKVLGTLSAGGDLDAYAVDLVAGDVLSLKGKPRPTTKGLQVSMAFDLLDPDGAVIFTGRHPADLKKPGVKNFVATRTGSHTLVLRPEGADADAPSTYTLGVKIKAAALNLTFAGATTGGVVPFPAARGGTVIGSLTGNVVPPVLLAPPGGAPSILDFTSKGTVLTFVPEPLDGDTGGWEVRFASVGSVAYKVRVKVAKRLVVPEDPDAALP